MTRIVSTNNSHKNRKSKKDEVFSTPVDWKLFLAKIVAWLYAALYGLGFVALCLFVLAGAIITLDFAILLGDPLSTGGDLGVFWICLKYVEVCLVISGVALAVMLVSYFGGCLLGKLYRYTRKNSIARKVIYAVGMVVFFPYACVRVFLDTSRKYWHTLQLLDLVIENI